MKVNEYHRDGNGGFWTTPLFWDCSCETDYIHSANEDTCTHCGDRRIDSPDSRVDEVAAHTASEA